MPQQENKPPQSPPSPPGDEFAGLRCPKCDYDLTGLVSLECPECGQELCLADLRLALKHSNKPLEGIARALFRANVFFTVCLIVILMLPMIARWFGFPSGVWRSVSDTVILVGFGLVATIPFAITTVIVAIMWENDRATFYGVFTILISIIAGGLFMITIAGW